MLLSGNESRYVKIAGQSYLYFGGTNYLGLAHRPELQNAINSCFESFGFSSGASRLTSGENEILLALEQELAEFCDAEAAITLPAGYMANQAAVEAIEHEVEFWVIADNAHASIKTAVKRNANKVIELSSDILFGADPFDYVCKHFGCSSSSRMAILLEPVNALTGRTNRVDKLISSMKNRPYFILDEAQSIGVLGENAKGALEHFKIESNERIIRTGTFSKAIGTYGGFVLASNSVIESLKNSSSAYRGSTSLPPLVCAASRESLRMIRMHPDSTISRLHSNIRFLNEVLGEIEKAESLLRFSFVPSQQHTPIYNLSDFEDLAALQESIFKKGIYIPSMKSYFPGAKEIGFRFTIQVEHTHDDLRRLVACLPWSAPVQNN